MKVVVNGAKVLLGVAVAMMAGILLQSCLTVKLLAIVSIALAMFLIGVGAGKCIGSNKKMVKKPQVQVKQE